MGKTYDLYENRKALDNFIYHYSRGVGCRIVVARKLGNIGCFPFFTPLSFQKMLTGIYWKTITATTLKTNPINFITEVLGLSILDGFVWG